MPKIHNIDHIPTAFVDDPGFESGLMTKFLGQSGGSEKIYVNMDYVKPGAKSTKYHSHSSQEEFFLVLKGRGTLRLNGENIKVGPGDFFSKPAGKGNVHQFINSGNEVLQILDCGTINRDDIISYPDEDLVYIKKDKAAFKNSDQIQNWSSDPHE